MPVCRTHPYLITPGFLERSDSIFLTQEPHVIPAMESVHDRTGSDAIPAAVRGDIAGSLEESDLDSGNNYPKGCYENIRLLNSPP